VAASIDVFGGGNQFTCGLNPICIPMLVEWRNCDSCSVVSFGEECHSGTAPIIARGECSGR
jgi:hypothetical protein